MVCVILEPELLVQVIPSLGKNIPTLGIKIPTLGKLTCYGFKRNTVRRTHFICHKKRMHRDDASACKGYVSLDYSASGSKVPSEFD